jgi:hypothetical protein
MIKIKKKANNVTTCGLVFTVMVKKENNLKILLNVYISRSSEYNAVLLYAIFARARARVCVCVCVLALVYMHEGITGWTEMIVGMGTSLVSEEFDGFLFLFISQELARYRSIL